MPFINKSCKNRFTRKIIAATVLAVTALIANPAQAYIPRNIVVDVETPYVFQLPGIFTPRTSTNNLNTHPLPRNLPVFLRSGENARFELSTHTAATAPLGFQIFCLQNVAQCVETQDSQATYSPKIHTKVSSVNLSINSTIIARNDVGMDQWALNPTEGDCEDYALSKRAQLVSAGMPAGALRIATALTPEGIGHAVLVMRTDQGDLVLDNLTNIVKPFNEVNIEILAISGINPTQWFNIA